MARWFSTSILGTWKFGWKQVETSEAEINNMFGGWARQKPLQYWIYLSPRMLARHHLDYTYVLLVGNHYEPLFDTRILVQGSRSKLYQSIPYHPWDCYIYLHFTMEHQPFMKVNIPSCPMDGIGPWSHICHVSPPWSRNLHVSFITPLHAAEMLKWW